MQLHIVVLLLTLMRNSRSANILALLNIHSSSNYQWKSPLLVGLVDRGHNVTVVCTNEQNKSMSGMTDDDLWTLGEGEDSMSQFLERCVSSCEAALHNQGMKELLDSATSTTFDLAIFEPAHGECFLGILHQFGSPPVIGLKAANRPQWTDLGMGTQFHSGFTPTLFQRLHDFVTTLYAQYLWTSWYLPAVNDVVDRHFGPSAPSPTEVLHNLSAILINDYPGPDNSHPEKPGVISVAGIHIKQPEPLPEDLQEFLDRAQDGTILCVLQVTGTVQEVFLRAFSNLSQAVLWDWGSHPLPTQPDNVRRLEGNPHTDILAHPNTRLFISDVSLLRMQEAMFHGVPVVGVTFGRQQNNMQQLDTIGIGVQLDSNTIKESTVLEAIHEVLQNSSYRQNAQRQSAMFRDQQDTPLERAIFWCELTIRQRGASHLRSPIMNRTWQIYVHLCVPAVILLFLVLAMRHCYRSLAKKKPRAKRKHR